MSAGVAISVLSLIWLGVLAYAQYRVNRRIVQMYDQLLWFSRAVENHSATMVRLQKMRMGLPLDFIGSSGGLIRRRTDYLTAMVRLSCLKGGRSGQYRKASLIERYSAATARLDLLHRISAWCPKVGALGNDPCGARYPDFV